MSESLIAQILFNGLVQTATYCLIAVGLTLVFGVMRIMNFAQGEIYMLGAYVVLLVYGRGNLPFMVAVLAAFLVTAVFGVVLDVGIFRHLREHPFMGFIASLGVSAILQVSVMEYFGSNFQAVPLPLDGKLEIFGASFVSSRILIIVAAGVLLVLLGVLLQRTRWGLAIQASAESSEAASLQGMNTQTYARLTMAISAGMAGLAGAVIAPTTTLDPLMGQAVILPAFAVVIIGGAGSIRGALVAATIIGFLQSVLTTTVDSQLAVGASLAAMLLVLTFRPMGLFARD
jgi:branched-chain amino acid transport system permease protein